MNIGTSLIPYIIQVNGFGLYVFIVGMLTNLVINDSDAKIQRQRFHVFGLSAVYWFLAASVMYVLRMLLSSQILITGLNRRFAFNCRGVGGV
jgi:hypothetical protein